MKQTIKKIALFTVAAILAVLNVQAQSHNIKVVTGTDKGTLTPKSSPDATDALSTAASGTKVYIIVTSENYRVDGLPVVKAVTDGGNAQARRNAPSILNNVEVTQNSLSQYEFTMPDFDVEISAAFIDNTTITENDVQVYWDAATKSDSKVYDGTDAKPTVVVGIVKTDGSIQELESDKYTVAFSPAEVKDAKEDYEVTITGTGDYSGQVKKTFSITKAPLTITAEDKEKVYGEALPELTAKYEGLVNNETAVVLSNLAITTPATATSAVGEYEITVSAESNNYEITAVAGKLTIKQRPVTVSGITASNKTYDGTATATLVLDNAKFADTEVVGDDELAVASATGTFVDGEGTADANIGADKTVKITEITLGGAAVANYVLAETGQQEETTASIEARDITEDATITIAEIPSQAYTGQAIKPELTVKFGEIAMVAGTDYTVAYTDSIEPGTAKATITGIGNFKGTKTANYTIYVPIYYYSVSVAQPENGSVAVSTDSAASGETVSVTATPDEDYELEAITVNGAAIEGDSFTMPDGEVTVSASFKRKEYTITVAQPEHGTLAASVEKSISGETISITATPDEGYLVDNITVNGTAIDGESFVMPKENVTVSGAFKQKTDLSGLAITLDWTSQPYTGEVQKAEVTSVALGEEALSAEDYTISYSDENPVNAGTYTITISGAKEEFSGSATATFTIEKVGLTVTADDQTMEKGAEMPALTISYAGFVNGETEAVLTEVPVATTEATADSDAGEYEIVVSGGSAANYDLSYVNGKLTITPAVIHTEDGEDVQGEVEVDEEGNKTVTLTDLTPEQLEDPSSIPTTITTADGEEIPVTEIAAEAFENMGNDQIVILPEGISTTEPVTNVINGDGTCETLDLTEVNGFEAPMTITAANVIYNREVTVEKFTVCLPYELPIPEDAKAFLLKSGVDGKAVFEEVADVLKAYMPYVIQVEKEAEARGIRGNEEEKENFIDLGATNVTITPGNEEVVKKDELEMIGTTTVLTHAEGFEKKAFIMQDDFSWKMTASEAVEDAEKEYLPPFSAYLVVVNAEGAAEVPEEGIGSEFEEGGEDDTTGIRDINADKFGGSVEGWYDMNGRRLEVAPKAKGVYIKDGTKVVIK